MSQPVENALHEALDRTTLGLGDNPARYQEVAARFQRRRRHRVAVSSAVAAVAVLTVGSTAAIDAARPDDPATSPTATTNAGDVAIECPSPAPSSWPTAEASPDSSPFVPEGAVAARACGLTDVTIRRNVDRLVAELNALASASGVYSCPFMAAPPHQYQLVLAYPDRDPVTVRVEEDGCQFVRSGGQGRRGGDLITDLVYELAAEQ